MNNNLAEKIVMALLAFANEQLQVLMDEETAGDHDEGAAKLLEKLDALRENV